MPHPVLRRPAIPRLRAGLPSQTTLPAFLMDHRALPMTPAPVMGPPDWLEAAITQGAIWDAHAAPVEFDSFNADEEVISVILEEGDGDVQLYVREGDGRVQILANGRPMASVAATGQAFSDANIFILQTSDRM